MKINSKLFNTKKNKFFNFNKVNYQCKNCFTLFVLFLNFNMLNLTIGDNKYVF